MHRQLLIVVLGGSAASVDLEEDGQSVFHDALLASYCMQWHLAFIG